eukprot:CAMPEP_0119132668 /NCGR_PEP_ID=MMETSP1310-20130426/12018_1 /TAXON_ID=464262 /ORGANISM="Genus nov. species nov., Strain RCC2339" /LENGTH=117 /DNA_ID=CAMNT_0007123313 /DNA_START=590 /DNA_END=941 /DNA_ORIENTATION=-
MSWSVVERLAGARGRVGVNDRGFRASNLSGQVAVTFLSRAARGRSSVEGDKGSALQDRALGHPSGPPPTLTPTLGMGGPRGGEGREGARSAGPGGPEREEGGRTGVSERPGLRRAAG